MEKVDVVHLVKFIKGKDDGEDEEKNGYLYIDSSFY